MGFEEIQVDKKRKLNPKEINSVPDEIWLKILNFLDQKTIFANFALVCKKFHELTLDSGAVKDIKLFNINDTINYQKSVKVLRRSKNLARVQLENCHTFGNDYIIEVFKSNPKLKSLIVETESVGEDWFKLSNSDRIIFGKELETLMLRSIKLGDNQDETVNEILSQKNLKNLQIPCLFDPNTGPHI